MANFKLNYTGEEVDHLLAKIEQAPDVIASEAYVQTEVANLVNSAPETLDIVSFSPLCYIAIKF